MAARSCALSEIARRLDVPQHKLLHLCEKGVVIPEIHDAAGRGSSRVFSADNFLEFASGGQEDRRHPWNPSVRRPRRQQVRPDGAERHRCRALTSTRLRPLFRPKRTAAEP